MKYPPPQQCPVCESKLTIQELKCDHCSTVIQGNFEATRLASLNGEQLHFVEVFLKVRGNIREMEKELGISYPTVRNRLDQIVDSLGFQSMPASPSSPPPPSQQQDAEQSQRKQILAKLDEGSITVEEALKLIGASQK
ncbi:hypothetical protein A8990_10233 [Paenibacillus taihuensis]|uniref:DUF2089 domain-containing protein n=1 Tax=Paenibacillus taihuensis TaxID=1156355 RepID=A0A3D9SI37_9BACL|nr:DUF2089 domain-containing protein [Paenibacillus taihuensis]REE92950.1 hypothetical protein A8990_10233 [Paenibacillus taihuensis]